MTTEPNSADRALALKVAHHLTVSGITADDQYRHEAAKFIAAHRSSAVAEAVAGLADSADKVRGSLEDERDSLKQAVAGLEAKFMEVAEANTQARGTIGRLEKDNATACNAFDLASRRLAVADAATVAVAAFATTFAATFAATKEGK